MGSMCAANNRVANGIGSSNKIQFSNSHIYHERQRRMLCAVHALNNLMQSRRFEKSELDKICESMTPRHLWNPHRNPFGLGNYDVNVLMAALKQEKFDVIWFDKRKKLTTLNLPNIFGFIINIPVPYSLLSLPIPFYEGKHWIALRQLPKYSDSSESVYYNLDSKLSTPIVIGDSDNAFLEYLQAQINDVPQVEILLVVTPEVSDERTWMKNDERP